MDFSTFAGVLETDYGATYKERRKFNTKFYIRNCGWLDFTSGLCAETETSIRLMHWPIGDFKATKPVVITLMYGRDISGGAESRIRRVMKLQPRYTHKQHWVYLGKNGTPMLTLCGELQH